MKILIVIGVFSSCIPQKKIKYLQAVHKDSTNRSEFVYTPTEDYQLSPGDNLHIRVKSLDESSNTFFNNMSGQTNSGYNDASIYLNSYTVDLNGKISFPYIGVLDAEGKTIEELKTALENQLSEYLVDATIIVRLVNFNITFVGEVRKPGEYKIYQDKINIFQAISIAGDITDYGNRNEVKLLRTDENGTKLYTLDLTKEDILESPYYFLKPNDIVYVEPLKSKQFAFSTFPYALLFSTITTIIVLLTFLNTRP
jgi:polysaccharide export outer membrane protein